MRTKSHHGFLLHLCVLIVAMFGLAACNGGGGGGGGDTSSNTGGGVQPVVYTGNLNSAVVTSANAGTLVSTAVTGGDIGGSVVTGVNIVTTPVSGEPRLTRIANIMHKTLSQADFGPSFAGGTHLNESGTESCLVSGSETFNIEVDDATGNLTGSSSFSACSDVSGESLSGSVTVTGHMLGVSTSNPQLHLLNASGTLTFTDASGSFTFTGSLAMTFTYATINDEEPDGVSVVANTDVFDAATGIYLRLTNYTLVVAIQPTFDDVSLSGTICHSVEGCVTVATVSPFRFNNPDLWPSSGQITATGVGNSSAARLTAVSKTLYDLEWDADGNGTYEGLLEDQLWSNL